MYNRQPLIPKKIPIGRAITVITSQTPQTIMVVIVRIKRHPLSHNQQRHHLHHHNQAPTIMILSLKAKMMIWMIFLILLANDSNIHSESMFILNHCRKRMLWLNHCYFCGESTFFFSKNLLYFDEIGVVLSMILF